MGVGAASGKDKAILAAKAAISSPLLETSIAGATGILVSITASPDIGLEDVDLASSMIAEEAHPDANIIWGATFDHELEDEMKVTIIATGFDSAKKKAAEAAAKEANADATAGAIETEEVESDLISDMPEKVADTTISDRDFGEIMNILNRSKAKRY